MSRSTNRAYNEYSSYGGYHNDSSISSYGRHTNSVRKPSYRRKEENLSYYAPMMEDFTPMAARTVRTRNTYGSGHQTLRAVFAVREHVELPRQKLASLTTRITRTPADYDVAYNKNFGNQYYYKKDASRYWS